jgi:hypothetical protein
LATISVDHVAGPKLFLRYIHFLSGCNKNAALHLKPLCHSGSQAFRVPPLDIAVLSLESQECPKRGTARPYDDVPTIRLDGHLRGGHIAAVAK